MQEKRKRTTDAGGDESPRSVKCTNSTTGRSCSCCTCTTRTTKHHAASEWGTPRPPTEALQSVFCADQRELLSASEVERLHAAKEDAKSSHHQVARCDRHLGLLAFSRIPAEDEATRVERRLQKLWRSPQEDMISNRGPNGSALSRASAQPSHDTLQLRDMTSPGRPDGVGMLAHDLSKREVQDWHASVASVHRIVNGAPVRGDAAVQVLAVRSLWTHITDFMTGLPFVVVQFEKQVASKYSTRRRAAYKSKVFFPLNVVDDWFPKTHGWLSQLAIAEDNLKILGMLHRLRQSSHYRANPKLDFAQVMRCAIWCKRWRMLQWLCHVLPRDLEWQWEPDLMSYALFHRDFSLMDWLFEICPDDSIKLSARKVEIEASGDMDMVRWLHEHHYSFSVWMMNAAAAKGSLEVVRFLHEHRSEGCTTDAMDLAARYGHLQVVEYLRANRTEGWTVSALEGAAQNGHLEVVRLLLERRTEGSIASATKAAVEVESDDVVAYLRRSYDKP